MDIALFSPLSLAGTLALLATAALSGAAAVWWVRRRRRAGRAGGVGRALLLVLGGLFVAGAAVNLVEEDALDLNPVFSATELVGSWRHAGATLTLAPNGTYACTPATSCGELGTAGRWERSADFELVFRPTVGRPVVERVVMFRGEHRLTQMDHIDLWNRELTFRHLAPAS